MHSRQAVCGDTSHLLIKYLSEAASPVTRLRSDLFLHDLAVNSCSFCPHFPSVGRTAVYHHTQLQNLNTLGQWNHLPALR